MRGAKRGGNPDGFLVVGHYIKSAKFTPNDFSYGHYAGTRLIVSLKSASDASPTAGPFSNKQKNYLSSGNRPRRRSSLTREIVTVGRTEAPRGK